MMRGQAVVLWSLCLFTGMVRAQSSTTAHNAELPPPVVAEPGTESHPNIFGGQDYELPTGERIQSLPNIFGGFDYRFPDGRTVTCLPNISGGQDCR